MPGPTSGCVVMSLLPALRGRAAVQVEVPGQPELQRPRRVEGDGVGELRCADPDPDLRCPGRSELPRDTTTKEEFGAHRTALQSRAAIPKLFGLVRQIR